MMLAYTPEFQHLIELTAYEIWKKTGGKAEENWALAEKEMFWAFLQAASPDLRKKIFNDST
jgi:hypothetical protein